MGRRSLNKITHEAVLIRDNRTCQYCGTPCEGVDHVIPWWLSKDDRLQNLVACCRSCNEIAGATVYEDFDYKKECILAVRAKRPWLSRSG